MAFEPVSVESVEPGSEQSGQAAALRRAGPYGRPLWLKALVLAAVLGAGVLAFYWHTIRSYAVTGASYGARVACSCRFVGGRSIGDCRKDFEPGMELVMLSEDAESRTITARFPFLARQTATYREGWGCVLESWPR